MALGCFMEDWWIPYDESYSMLFRSIESNLINKQELAEEFNLAFHDYETDFQKLVLESQLLISPENYSNEDNKNYIKFLLQDYLFPEQVMTSVEIEKLNVAVEDILKKDKSNDGWVLAYEVFQQLKTQEQFKDLEYFNLWKLPFFVPYKYYIDEILMTGKNYFNQNGFKESEIKIERKSIGNKDREIGYFRYNESLT